MKYTISEDRRTLTITVDEREQKELRDWPQEHEGTERLVCNSELEWIPEGSTGDLTSAPMLGILGEESTIEQIEQMAKSKPGIYGSRLCGHWEGKDRHQPILERWCFMDYQVRSVLEDLHDKGCAVFVNGE